MVNNLPPDARLWDALRMEQERALKPRAEQIRERQEHYARLREQQQPEEASE